jgi:hypothetical protein
LRPNDAPHSRQNFDPEGFSCWQRGHCMPGPSQRRAGAGQMGSSTLASGMGGVKDGASQLDGLGGKGIPPPSPKRRGPHVPTSARLGDGICSEGPDTRVRSLFAGPSEVRFRRDPRNRRGPSCQATAPRHRRSGRGRFQPARGRSREGVASTRRREQERNYAVLASCARTRCTVPARGIVRASFSAAGGTLTPQPRRASPCH